MQERLLTAEDVAEWFQVTPAWVQQLARDGEIPAVRLGRYWRFDRVTLDEWWRARQIMPATRRSS
jgi:excisionase family DNA binding protein